MNGDINPKKNDHKVEVLTALAKCSNRAFDLEINFVILKDRIEFDGPCVQQMEQNIKLMRLYLTQLFELVK